MGNISTILAALFCATAPVSSIVIADGDLTSEVVQQEAKLGKERISSIRKAYENGEFNSFLQEMDDSFKKADLSGLIQMRSKDVPVQFQEEWEKSFLDLQKEKTKDLLAALSDTDNSTFAAKVRAASLNLLTPEQEKALSKLNSLIAKAPNTGASADENRLIEIDLEYEYKILHGHLPNSGSPLEQFAQHMALRMEKMGKMVEASKSFQDADLKQAVGIAQDTLDARLARNLDMSELNLALKNKGKAANATEEKVYSILSQYQEKFSELMKEIDQANR